MEANWRSGLLAFIARARNGGDDSSINRESLAPSNGIVPRTRFRIASISIPIEQLGGRLSLHGDSLTSS